ncbi:DUF2057 family protein [Colwelliaceae bacterium BS250]
MKVFLSLLLTLLPISTIAAQLTLPPEFVVMRVNGEEYSTSIFLSDTKVNLPTGQNVLVLQYAEMFEEDLSDNTITVKSKPFILLFSVGPNDKLSFSFPKSIDKQSATQYAKQPVVTIKQSNGQSLALINQSLANYNDEVMKQTLARRQEVVKQSLDAKDDGAFTKTSPETIDMLKYWWQQASEADKQQFLDYIKQQNKSKK